MTIPLGNANLMIHRLMEDEDPAEMMTRSLEAEVESRGWDKPMFIAVLSHAQGIGPVAYELPGPPELFSSGPQGIELLADILSKNTDGVADKYAQAGAFPRNFVGLFVSSEGWYVPEPEEGTPEHDAWDQARERYEFHKHPDRIEERISFAVTPSWMTQMIRIRGQVPTFRKITEPEEIKANLIGGRLTRAAIELANAISARCEFDEVTL